MQIPEEPPSLSLHRPPRVMVAMVIYPYAMVAGHRNWLARGDSQCPMNALHFHTSPGGQRERLTRLFNPRSSYRLRSACPRFVSFRFVSDNPNHSRRTLSLILTPPYSTPSCVNLRKIEGTSCLAKKSSPECSNCRMLVVKRDLIVSLSPYFIAQNKFQCFISLMYYLSAKIKSSSNK